MPVDATAERPIRPAAPTRRHVDGSQRASDRLLRDDRCVTRSTGPRLVVRVALAVLGAGLGACGAGAGHGSTAAAPPPARCSAARTTTLPDGFLRVPAGARAGRTPLLVVTLPGGHGDPDDALGVTRAAARRGFAVLYPTRRRGFFWTLNRAQGTSDVRRVGALLDRVLATGCIDPARISITGVSNGAGFATRMSCEQPRRFAAVVAIAAGYRALDPCPRSARASFLAIHGSADAVVPYNGKPPDRAGSVPRYVARRARRDGCAPQPRTTRPRARVSHIVYRGCDDGLRVEILRLAGTTHGWPGAPPRAVAGRNPSGVDATRELVRFVDGARRPAP
jgi:polyhydroxybutyrate depolymerase